MLLYKLNIGEESVYPLNIEFYCIPPRPAKPRAHWHHNLEISCAFTSEGEYIIEGNVYEVRKGDIFIFNSEENHALGVHPPQIMNNMVINFDPRFIWSLESSLFDARYLSIFLERVHGQDNRIQRESEAAVAIYRLFQEIDEEVRRKRPEYNLMIKTKFLTILAEILRHYSKMDLPMEAPHSQGLALINTVIEHIDQHLEDGIRLDDLARLCHMNPSYFSTFFKKFMGLSPKEFITRRRIQRAVEYIRTSEKTVLDIAHCCGFNNTSSFNKAFKKMTGKTPSEFRRFSNQTTLV